MKNSRHEAGFTLLEVIAAIAVFAFGMLALYRLQASTLMNSSFSNELTRSSQLAQDRMEELMGWPYRDPGDGSAWLNDADDDGGGVTNRDLDNDGLDDVGNSFGLDDAAPGTADGCITINSATNAVSDCALALSPGVVVRLFHNIAVDQPLANTKTIRVIATWRDKRNIPHRSTFTCVKAINF